MVEDEGRMMEECRFEIKEPIYNKRSYLILGHEMGLGQ
jgi:hypothetical protein